MSDINEKQNISRKEIQNVYTTLQDLYSYYSLELESISEYGYNSILKAFYNLLSVSYYQYFINIIFIILVFIILYILYRDIIYRNANNIKRCKILKNNINANMSYENPFVYNIYIIEKDKLNDLLDEYVVVLKYNFNKYTDSKDNNPNPSYYFNTKNYKNINKVLISDNKIDKYKTILNIEDTSGEDNMSNNKFTYFDLNNMKHQYLKYKIDDEYYFINKTLLNSENYEYVVTTADNQKISEKKDKNVKKLAKFVRDYGYDTATQLAPLFNIIYSVEYRKNK